MTTPNHKQISERAAVNRTYQVWAFKIRRKIRHWLTTVYEWRLDRQIVTQDRPSHVGIILDGNRRYAKKLGIADTNEIYDLGAEKLIDVLKWCDDLSVRFVTIWVLSTDNLRNRPPDELSSILAVFEKKLKGIVNSQVIQERKIRIKAVGRLELLPASTMDAIREAEAATSKYDAFRLNIAVAYGGREEISDAVKSMLKDAVNKGIPLNGFLEHINPEEIARHLYSVDLPEPDLIIRTSGELRLSGFLLWQSAYSEFYFADVFWPEFRRIDFLRAIRSYQQRKRRFGS
jgi:short-chain Z-isoprenyl diphosphate synthase